MTYISRIDNEIANGTRNLSYADELGLEKIIFNADVLIENGDIFEFGNTTIKCRLTPGHTDGTLSFFFTTPGENGNIIAAMHGGIGTNTLAADFLNKYNIPFDNRRIFVENLNALYDQHVDIVLGNHPNQNDTVGKLKKVESGNSILDTGEWNRLLKYAENNLIQRIKSEEVECNN